MIWEALATSASSTCLRALSSAGASPGANGSLSPEDDSGIFLSRLHRRYLFFVQQHKEGWLREGVGAASRGSGKEISKDTPNIAIVDNRHRDL